MASAFEYRIMKNRDVTKFNFWLDNCSGAKQRLGTVHNDDQDW